MSSKIEDDLRFFCPNVLESKDEKEERVKNQKEAYWCTEKRHTPELFANAPQQRIMARLIRSYQNTTWHRIQLSVNIGDDRTNTEQPEVDCGNAEQTKGKLITDDWFNDPNIIKKVTEWLVQSPGKDKRKGFYNFCSKAWDIVKLLDNLSECCFEKEQTVNFAELSRVIEQLFEKHCDKNNQKDLEKSQKVSAFEKELYDKLAEPYKTIMKMQKLLPGLGVALTCDFLKEAHLCNIAKPDVHLCHAFSLIDKIPYSMDLALVKRVKDFADQVCPANPDDFCNSGSYYVDKIIWMRLNKGGK